MSLNSVQIQYTILVKTAERSFFSQRTLIRNTTLKVNIQSLVQQECAKASADQEGACCVFLILAQKKVPIERAGGAGGGWQE